MTHRFHRGDPVTIYAHGATYIGRDGRAEGRHMVRYDGFMISVPSVVVQPTEHRSRELPVDPDPSVATPNDTTPVAHRLGNGQRVYVAFEAEIVKTDDDFVTVTHPLDPHNRLRVPPTAVTPIDDPGTDVDGTVRRHRRTGRVVVATDAVDHRWATIRMGTDTRVNRLLRNDEVRRYNDWDVTGTLQGLDEGNG